MTVSIVSLRSSIFSLTCSVSAVWALSLSTFLALERTSRTRPFWLEMSSLRDLCSFSWTLITSGSWEGGSASLRFPSTSRNQLRSSSISPRTSPDFCLARAILSPRLCTCSQIASNLLLSLVTNPSMALAPSPGESWHSWGPVRLIPSRSGLCSWISPSRRWISPSCSSRLYVSSDWMIPSTPFIQSDRRLWDWWKFWTRGSISWAFFRRSAALDAKSLYFLWRESSLSLRDNDSSFVMCFINSFPIATTLSTSGCLFTISSVTSWSCSVCSISFSVKTDRTLYEASLDSHSSIHPRRSS